MNFDHPVVSALLPVALLILVGFGAGRFRWVRPEAVKDLSNLVFLVLTQALLFRTMSSVHLERLDMRPVFQYFVVVGLVFFASVYVHGRTARASVLALGSVFSNTVMIGIPLVGLAFGQDGQVLLLSLIALHALVLLTVATIVIELQLAHEQAQVTAERAPLWRMVAQAVRSTVLHPVPLPILLGLAYAQTGWGLHPVIDKPLQMLAGAFGPIALLLVGVSLAQIPLGHHLKTAFKVAAVKTMIHPLLMFAVGWLLGLRGLHLSVMVVAAALPIGANVFLFSQRYALEEESTTGAVALSTALSAISVSVALALLPH